MNASSLHLQWLERGLDRRFRTGVSLHSHTLHSRESLDFIYRAAEHSSPLAWVLRRGEARYYELSGEALDLRKGWWTPPLGPREAYDAEAAQIRELNLEPLVSLTDHDDIEAGMSLQAIDASLEVPISVEWTVPYRGTFFHVGVHNLAPANARSVMKRLSEFTANPEEDDLAEIFEALAARPETLVILNHPFWDESGAGAYRHKKALLDLVACHRSSIHAFEINGLRPWRENRLTLQLAKEWDRPYISGGDRHILEPNTVLNLTRAASMSEFVAEVRAGISSVLITPRYRESYALRIFHNMLDVFRTYEKHGRGWKDWADRVFYTMPGGNVCSLAEIWGTNPPPAVLLFSKAMRFAGQPAIRQALRAALPLREEVGN
jgi:hypothetical protein